MQVAVEGRGCSVLVHCTLQVSSPLMISIADCIVSTNHIDCISFSQFEYYTVFF